MKKLLCALLLAFPLKVWAGTKITSQEMGPQLTTPSTFTVQGQDANGYSVSLSSGLNMPNGTVNAKALKGDGSAITGLGGALSGGQNTKMAIWQGPTTLGNSSFVSEVSSGVTISSNAAIANLTASSATVTNAATLNGPVSVNNKINSWVWRDSFDIPKGGPASYSISLAPYLYSSDVGISSITWRVDWECIDSSAAYFGLGFNNDTGANYYMTTCAGTTCDTSATSHYIETGIAVGLANSPKYGSMEFSVLRSTSNYVKYHGHGSSSYSSISEQLLAYISGTYRGAGGTTLTSVEFYGTIAAYTAGPDGKVPLDCHIELWRKGFQHQ